MANKTPLTQEERGNLLHTIGMRATDGELRTLARKVAGRLLLVRLDANGKIISVAHPAGKKGRPTGSETLRGAVRDLFRRARQQVFDRYKQNAPDDVLRERLSASGLSHSEVLAEMIRIRRAHAWVSKRGASTPREARRLLMLVSDRTLRRINRGK